MYNSLCKDCYISKNRFIQYPDNIRMEVCPNCGATKRGETWIDNADLESSIEDNLLKKGNKHEDVEDFKLKIVTKREDEHSMLLSIESISRVFDLEVKESHESIVYFNKNTCDACSRLHGNYWEAKVQIRGAKHRALIDDEIDTIANIAETYISNAQKDDRLAFITRMERIHNGLDICIGSKNAAKALVKKISHEFGGKVIHSDKLVGKKDGKDVHRMTYAVKLPIFKKGDFIDLNNKPLKVQWISGSKAGLFDLETGESTSIDLKGLEKAKLIGGDELVKDMIVISRSEREIQVQDPDTLKTIDILVPPDFKYEGDTVRVLKSELGYFLLN